MLAKFSVDQALMKARSHVKNEEIEEAKRLYQAILMDFPKNIRAQKELASLNNHLKNNIVNSIPSNTINQLINMYNQGQLTTVVELAQSLVIQHPQAFVVWNILGAANIGLGQVEKASEAFKKVTDLNPNYADGFNNLGITLKDQGKLDKAIEAFNRALSIKPDYADAYNNIGNTFKYQGKLNKAIEAYNKALTLKPNYPEAYYNMGASLKDQGNLDKAIEAYNKAITLNPNYAEAYSNLGVALMDQGELITAIEACKRAITLKPNYAEVYNNIGVILHKQSELEKALEYYNKALSLKPDYPEVYNNIGDVLKDNGELENAIESFKKALLIKPYYPQAFVNIGNALKEQGKWEAATKAYIKAIKLKPDYAEAYNNIGNTLKYQGKIEDAIEAYNRALSIKPDYADAYNNLGFVLIDKGNLDEAIEACNKAITIKPDYADAYRNLSFALLNHGKLKEGLEKYEWRLRTRDFIPNLRHFSLPMWDGKKSLHNKKILVWSEQGIGDTINWSSCLSLLASKAKKCILECQEKLVPLLARSFPYIEVKPENKNLDTKRDDFDFHLPMGSLYKYFIHEFLESKKVDHFLIPDPARVNFWKERLKSLGNGPYIGISWKSSNMSPERLPDSTSILDWSPLLRIPNVTFINLQYSNYAEDLIKIKREIGVTVHNFDDIDHYNDIDDVAALCTALNIVVSTKLTVPLISAAVGTSTKLANWRQSSSNNILLNPISSSVDIYERNTSEPWDHLIHQISEDIIKQKKINYEDSL